LPGASTHTTGIESRLALSALAPETLQSEIRAMTTECDRMGGINLA
jgi:aminotransferase